MTTTSDRTAITTALDLVAFARREQALLTAALESLFRDQEFDTTSNRPAPASHRDRDSSSRPPAHREKRRRELR